jgi:hypothetical protein
MVVDPADGLVDEVRGQVIAGFWRGRIFDRAGIVIEMRFPLVVVSGQKSIEMVETQEVGQWLNGPAGLISHAGVLCHLPKAAVE